MRVLSRASLLVTLVLGICSGQSRAVSDPNALYVSASGDDKNDGRSIEHAFRSLEQARQASRVEGAPKTILVSGDFTLTKPFELGPEDSGSRWQTAPGATASFAGAAGVSFGFSLRGANGVTISG